MRTMDEQKVANQPFQKIEDVVRTTGLSAWFLRRGCREGSIPCVRSGRTIYVNVPALLRQFAVEVEANEETTRCTSLFDIRSGMKRLSTSDKGRLFDAILDYAENGVVPDFEGGLGVAWDFIVQKLDKDAETYAAKSVANQYGPYVREQEKRGLPTITREEWCALSDAERKHLMSFGIE